MMVKDKLQMYVLKLSLLYMMGMGTQKSHMHLEAAWPQEYFGEAIGFSLP